MLREMSRLDTLGASPILAQLRESNGSGVGTHYVLGPAAKGAAVEPMANRGELGENPSLNRGELGTDRGKLLPVPEDLLRELEILGLKPPMARLRELLTSWWGLPRCAPSSPTSWRRSSGSATWQAH
jgi:hypothetical protein